MTQDKIKEDFRADVELYGMIGELMFIGIDNGLDGGIVAIDENQKIIGKWIMPTIKLKRREFDVRRIVEIFNELVIEPDKVYVILEKAHVRPVSGKVQCFTTGFGYGIFVSLLEC